MKVIIIIIYLGHEYDQQHEIVRQHSAYGGGGEPQTLIERHRVDGPDGIKD